MDHAAEETIAIVRVFGGVENVLMPELVQVVLSLGIGPGYKHEARLHLKQIKKTDVFLTSGFRPFQAPALLFHQGFAHGVEIEFFGDDVGLGGERIFISGEPTLYRVKDDPRQSK